MTEQSNQFRLQMYFETLQTHNHTQHISARRHDTRHEPATARCHGNEGC